jgi:hypothetical protein
MVRSHCSGQTPGVGSGVALMLALGLCAACCAMDMNVNLVAGGSQAFPVEQVRKITYDLGTPVTMNVILMAGTTTPFQISAVRSVTFTGVWTGVNRRKAERLTAQMTRFSARRFGGMATLSFSLTQAENVAVSVYAVDGRLLRTLLSGVSAAGEHVVFWDGRDASGTSVATGTYIMRLDRKQEARAFRFVTLR